MKNKISTNLIGPSVINGFHNFGLCNQLFQIATVVSYAHDNNFDAVFPMLNDTNHYGNYRENIFRNLNINDSMPENHGIYVEPRFAYTPIPVAPTSFIIKDSYCQSEKYFKHNRQLILDTFGPRDEDLEYIEKKYGDVLKENTVSCHIRRGDFTTLHESHPCLYDTGYYDNALNEIDHSVMVVFSDDIEWCESFFANRDAIFVREEDYLDLYIMSMCKHNIIANSTFSWWGAWFNQNPDKKVTAPLSWFGNDKPHGGRGGHSEDDLIPENWVRL